MEFLDTLKTFLGTSFSDVDPKKQPQKRVPWQAPETSPERLEQYQSVMTPRGNPEPENLFALLQEKLGDAMLAARDPKKVVKFLAEAALDPTNLIPAGKAAIPAVALAFRPSNSRMLPSQLVYAKKDIEYAARELGALERGEVPNLTSWPGLLLNSKISGKEIEKYGTPEFKLDPYLTSTNALNDGGKPRAPLATLSNHLIFNKRTNDELMRMVKRDTKRGLSPGESLGNLKYDEDTYTYAKMVDDNQAFFSQLREGTPLYMGLLDVSPEEDVNNAIKQLAPYLRQSSFTYDQLSKKSLVQLISIADAEKAKTAFSPEQLKAQSIKRTAETGAKFGLPKGFARLETPADFGLETSVLEHCVGAGACLEGIFKPKYHPITGKELIKSGFDNSADRYIAKSNSGETAYFSYRPEGLPVATIEMDMRTGEVYQKYGAKNSRIPPEHLPAVDSFIREQQQKLFPNGVIIPPRPRGWRQIEGDMPNLIEDL